MPGQRVSATVGATESMQDISELTMALLALEAKESEDTETFRRHLEACEHRATVVRRYSEAQRAHAEEQALGSEVLEGAGLVGAGGGEQNEQNLILELAAELRSLAAARCGSDEEVACLRRELRSCREAECEMRAERDRTATARSARQSVRTAAAAGDFAELTAALQSLEASHNDDTEVFREHFESYEERAHAIRGYSEAQHSIAVDHTAAAEAASHTGVLHAGGGGERGLVLELVDELFTLGEARDEFVDELRRTREEVAVLEARQCVQEASEETRAARPSSAPDPTLIEQIYSVMLCARVKGGGGGGGEAPPPQQVPEFPATAHASAGGTEAMLGAAAAEPAAV
eukprot:NODE_1360_length_1166_cov_214.900090.p1 GENE.NODE_1360_length_1166_cov_214.900090~~NODE_1360_length_1166_cov_214.900090.p1  ORF type:complete len:346 (-),score=93.90 NODE_1360_length_1166_cov_214.900090:39-1076(-)